MKKRLLNLFLLGCGIGCLSLFFIFNFLKPLSYVSSDFPSSPPELGGPFSLIDQYGHRRTLKEFEGKYVLIYFGYTYCPDICPLGLNHISKALTLLGQDRDKIVPIFITIDPLRDTVELLKLYAQNFNANFIMLTGTTAEIEAVKKDYKVFAKRSDKDDKMSDYLLDHSTLVYLLNKKGQFIRMFPHSTDPEKMAAYINSEILNDIKGRQ